MLRLTPDSATDKITELLEVRDTAMTGSAADMLLHDVRKGFTPRIAGEPLHQAGESMR
jgi:hypothetical protein